MQSEVKSYVTELLSSAEKHDERGEIKVIVFLTKSPDEREENKIAMFSERSVLIKPPSLQQTNNRLTERHSILREDLLLTEAALI